MTESTEQFQSITELQQPPVVGRTYLVPMIFVPADVLQLVDPAFSEGWWPTMGPGHSDPDIPGGQHWHYHLDARFLTKEQVRNRLSFSSLHMGAARMENLWACVIGGQAVSALQTEIRPAVCRRRAPRHPLDCPDVEMSRPWLEKLEQEMAGKKLKCMTCPHRGIHVGSIAVDKDGGVTCPGHGLRWNRATGELMPRPLAQVASPTSPRRSAPG